MTTKTRLSDDIIVYITKPDLFPRRIEYSAESTCLQSIRLTLSIKGSENMAFDQISLPKTEKESMVVLLTPGRIVSIGSLIIVDPFVPAKLVTDFVWEYVAFDDVMALQFLREQQISIKSEIDTWEQAIQSTISSNDRSKALTMMDFDARIAICRQFQCKFVDLEFPPTEESIGMTEAIGQKKPLISWRRPRQFMPSESKIEVFKHGIYPGDIKQGAIANCWLMCALASLAEYPRSIQSLFTTRSHHANDDGIYELRICKRGNWQSFFIDDHIPCAPGAGPIYSRAHENELWVLLVEKAYAKSFGSYYKLRHGWAFEALIDFTGAPFKNYRLDDESIIPTIRDGRLWRDLLEFDKRGCLMCASTPGEDHFSEVGRRPPKEASTGLVAGHAYSLIAVKQTRSGHQLIRLRNPWGQFEWRGDWSDSSPLWTPEIEDEVGANLDADDGEFWMSFQDVIKYFFSINVAITRNPECGFKPWHAQRHSAYLVLHPVYRRDVLSPELLLSSPMLGDLQFAVDVPLYMMTVKKTTIGYCSIHQTDRRDSNAKPYIDIGICVMRINETTKEFEFVSATGCSVDRQIQTDEIVFTPGEYICVPVSTGCSLLQDICQSRLPSQQQQQVSLVTRDDQLQVIFSTEMIAVLTAVFDRLDISQSGYLTFAEMDELSTIAEGCELSRRVYDWMLRKFGSPGAVGLDLSAFLTSQLYMVHHMIKQHSLDPMTASLEDINIACESVRNEIEALGFDRKSLELVGGRAVTVVIHTDLAVNVDCIPFDPDAFEEALELPIIANGEKYLLDEGNIQFSFRRAGYNGVSFVVANLKPSSVLHFALDCSQSKNAASHTGSLISVVTVAAGEAKVIQHLIPQNLDEDWSWGYEASFRWA